jgi:pimeloyl-ACP methyl ester carboxylesterase
MPRLQIVLAAILLLAFLLLPPAEKYDSYLDTLSRASMTLKGQAPYADVAQDFYGFRALLTNQDPYAILTRALETMGITWKANFSSTHPPTAFLVVAPVALLPWPLSSMVWAWLMLTLLCISLRMGLGYSWDLAVLITVLALYWPPIATSLDQITIVWLSGLAIAFRYGNDRPLRAGALIAVAAFTKLMPAVAVLPFLLRRRWQAIIGFILAWLAAIGILFVLSPKTLIHYFTSNSTNGLEIMNRWDNGSFILFLYKRVGIAGLLISCIVVLVFFTLAYGKYRRSSNGDIPVEEWNIWVFLAVLMMPITWIFSISPLLPNLLSLLEDRRWIIRVLAICAFLPPMLVLPFGTGSTMGLFGFFLFAGLAFALAQSEMRWSTIEKRTSGLEVNAR